MREFTLASDMVWSLPVPLLQYTEKIERMFKHKIPGSKAPFYKIRIRGMQGTDSQTKNIIEEHIRVVVSEMQPGYADFLKIEWIE